MDELIAERYRVTDKIGEGGMGVVLAAYDEKLYRNVVLKAILPDKAVSEHARQRFHREAQILAQLDHPYICRCFDLIDEQGTEYLVLEHIEGKPLDEVLKEGLDDSRKLPITTQILEALVVAHTEGVVHRDLKPSNVMITPEGDVKVLDFGLAQLTGQEELGTDLSTGSIDLLTSTDFRTIGMKTEAGSVSGTLLYMSPEQARGEAVASASDMYSLGLVLQELWTGKRPYPDCEMLELYLRAQQGEALPIEGVDKDVTQLLNWMQSNAAADRPTAKTALERARWIRGKPKRKVQRLLLSGFVVIAIGSAVKYTVDVKIERDSAIEAHSRAEDLILNVLLDQNLTGPLRKVGRLGVLDEAYVHAMAYLEKPPAGRLANEELMVHCRLTAQIARDRAFQGRREDAISFAKIAVNNAESLLERDPDSSDLLMTLSECVFYLALTHSEFGEYQEAERHFVRYLEISQDLLATEPDNPSWSTEVAYAWTNLGGLHCNTGDIDKAVEELEKALAIWNEKLAASPGELDLLSEKAEVQSFLARAYFNLEQYQRAVDILREEVEIVTRAWENTESPHDRIRVGVCLSWLGQSLLELGEKDAVPTLAASVGHYEALHLHDRENADWKLQLTGALMSLGRAHRSTGQAAAAADSLDRARALTEELLAMDADNQVWQKRKALIQELSGELGQ